MFFVFVFFCFCFFGGFFRRFRASERKELEEGLRRHRNVQRFRIGIAGRRSLLVADARVACSVPAKKKNHLSNSSFDKRWVLLLRRETVCGGGNWKKKRNWATLTERFPEEAAADAAQVQHFGVLLAQAELSAVEEKTNNEQRNIPPSIVATHRPQPSDSKSKFEPSQSITIDC